MGYTHYWNNTAKVIPEAALVILREILDEAYAAGVVQFEDTIQSPPFISEREIRFNGVGNLGHETFYFDLLDTYRDEDGAQFAFCKTAQKPYDVVVMKVLIVLKHFLGKQVKVMSDGDFNDEWRDVRAEIEARYGIATAPGDQLETSR